MISEQEILNRCARALQQLKYLSEVPAKNLSPQPRSPGHEGHPPANHRDSLSWALRRLLRACEEIELEAKKIKTKQKVKTETVDQFRARIVTQYAGQQVEVVVASEGLKAAYVERLRRDAGCDPTNGKRLPRREGANRVNRKEDY